MKGNVLASLKLMGMGMTAIFFVIIVIYIAINLMLKWTKNGEAQ